jgi:hypothetical protein
MKLEFSQQVFEKPSTIKFHENPSSGSRVVPCGRTDMTKLIVAFRSFANALKKPTKYAVYSEPSQFVFNQSRTYFGPVRALSQPFPILLLDTPW